MAMTNCIPLNGKELRMLFSIESYDYIPILSVLKDDYSQLYLCLCSEIRDKMRWIISLTTFEVIQALVDLKLSVNQALRKVQDQVFVVEYCDGKYSCQTLSFSKINPLYLAEEDTYAEFQDEDVDDNLGIWKRLLMNVSTDYFTNNVDIDSSTEPQQESARQYHKCTTDDYIQQNNTAKKHYSYSHSTPLSDKEYAGNVLIFAA